MEKRAFREGLFIGVLPLPFSRCYSAGQKPNNWEVLPVRHNTKNNRERENPSVRFGWNLFQWSDELMQRKLNPESRYMCTKFVKCVSAIVASTKCWADLALLPKAIWTTPWQGFNKKKKVMDMSRQVTKRDDNLQLCTCSILLIKYYTHHELFHRETKLTLNIKCKNISLQFCKNKSICLLGLYAFSIRLSAGNWNNLTAC